MRVSAVALILVGVLLPAAGAAQTSASVAYQPNPASARLHADAASAAAQDTVTVDPYRVDDTVALSAAVGGIIGGLAVAIHTVADSDQELMPWGAAVAIPIIGGLIGAGVGYLIR